jgi:hypothetical protein
MPMNPTTGRKNIWKRRILYILLAILGIALFNAVFGLVVTYRANGVTGHPWCSPTAGDAKWNGTLVATLTASPSDIDWHGEEITINEVWVERPWQRVYTVVLIPGLVHIPINRELPGYTVGFNLKRGHQVFEALHGKAQRPPFFVQEGRGAGFTEDGPANLFYDHLPEYDYAPIKVQLRQGWDSGDVKEIILAPQR